jgi:glycine/D-amino acid oxidase-like deaminating enzyme
MTGREQPIDLLVLGGGMAGLAAAAPAAQSGASVVLVEKAPRTGGSAIYAGFIWTAPTLEVMREINPRGDPALAARLVDGYPDAIEWVRSLGVEVRAPSRGICRCVPTRTAPVTDCGWRSPPVPRSASRTPGSTDTFPPTTRRARSRDHVHVRWGAD